jgi:hypothetical protein
VKVRDTPTIILQPNPKRFYRSGRDCYRELRRTTLLRTRVHKSRGDSLSRSALGRPSPRALAHTWSENCPEMHISAHDAPLARGNNVRVNTDTPLGGMRVKERIREAGHPGERVLGTRSGPHSLWVVLDGGGAPALPLGVFLPDGTEAVALFSGEEEARMFCHLGGKEGANRRVRETSAGEVLSLLYRAGRPVRRVALDPFAEVVPGGGSLGTSTLSAERFARRFARPDPERVGGGPPWR